MSMRLNDEIPGLPEWPYIFRSPDNSIEVAAKHLTYAGRRSTRTAVFWVLMLGGAGSVYIINMLPDKSDLQGGFGMLALSAMAFFYFFGLSRFLEGFFMQTTRVHFTEKEIVINGKAYSASPSLSIMFRAEDSPVPDVEIRRLERVQQERDKTTFDDLKFRSVEMVWGARIVFITSVADERRARQFAIALQMAYKISQEEKCQQAYQFTYPDWGPGRLPE